MKRSCLFETDTYCGLQEAYKERERKIGRKWKFMSKSDAQLYSVTGSDPLNYSRSFTFLTGWQGWILFRLIRPVYRQFSEPNMDL